jgi:hypothetical protein
MSSTADAAWNCSRRALMSDSTANSTLGKRPRASSMARGDSSSPTQRYDDENAALLAPVPQRDHVLEQALDDRPPSGEPPVPLLDLRVECVLRVEHAKQLPRSRPIPKSDTQIAKHAVGKPS